ncbi:MAG: Curdlan synthase, partial [Rhizobium sp.]|nr:Curdlan synthase [Rhizobium sp.]
ARIRGVQLLPGAAVELKIRDIGDMQAFVLETTGDGAVLSLELDEHQYEALLRRLYAQGAVPSVTSTRLSAVLGEALSRLERR